MSHLKWATVTSSQDEIQASLIANALQEENIPAITHNKKDSVYVMLGSVFVLVPEDQLEEAQQILIDKKIVDEDAFSDEE